MVMVHVDHLNIITHPFLSKGCQLLIFKKLSKTFFQTYKSYSVHLIRCPSFQTVSLTLVTK